MVEPVWIRTDVVRAIHLRQLSEHGGSGGIRDAGLLESALSRPRNLWAYTAPKPDVAAMAASYAFGIVKNHPFIDGNKRTGLVVMRTFLSLNDGELEASQVEKFQAIYGVAEGAVSEADLADWIRRRLRKSS